MDGVAGRQWQAYRRWRAVAGELADYVQAAPFLAGEPVAPRRPAHPQGPNLARFLTHRLSDGGEFVLLEAPARLGLDVAFRLLGQRWSVAPLISRWPAPHAILPTQPLAAWLSAVPPGGGGRPLCLVLDAGRYPAASAARLRRRFDNRYRYLDHMLPPATKLREWDIARVLWIGTAAMMPADLVGYERTLTDAGISVAALSFATALKAVAACAGGPGQQRARRILRRRRAARRDDNGLDVGLA